MDVLNQKAWMLIGMLASGDHPRVMFTYFKSDALKAGGEYVTITGFIKKIDDVGMRIILFGSDNIVDKTIPPIEIAIEKAISIEGEMFTAI